MTLRDRFSLLFSYGGGFLLVGALYNLAGAAVRLMVASHAFTVYVLMIKVPFAAALLYLFWLFAERDKSFFYANLGYGRRRLLKALILIDFAGMVLCLILANILRPWLALS